jgi:hypothetical protein
MLPRQTRSRKSLLTTLNQTFPDFVVRRRVGGRAGAKYEIEHRASGFRTVCILSSLRVCQRIMEDFERDRNNTGYWRPRES